MMEIMDWSLALPAVYLLLGACATFFADSLRHRRSRKEMLQDGLRKQRGESYISFLNAAHLAGHTLGRSAPGCPNPLEPDPATFWLVDSEVTQKLRAVEIVGGDVVVARAREVKEALLHFRAEVQRGAPYGSFEYWDAYRPVSRARDLLVSAARDEVGADR